GRRGWRRAAATDHNALAPRTVKGRRPVDTDRTLLFGVLALQADLLDPARFAEACSAWAARKDTPLADLLVERGWLGPEDRADVSKLLQRKLRKHGGDAQPSMVALTTSQVR